ncbi:unnamed protein product [Caenorhabditis auriculariae]|uniref:Piwi domain-containing protein n=1 Tax=Caenorhabditis auriculariae TaxID=2777116 RepID=A0A8S1HPA8_9PELO|nr:unnamed protein product [Caenorhabditis auriculariae]
MESVRGRGRGSGGSGSGSGLRDESRKLLGTIHGDLFTRPAMTDKRGSSGTVEQCMVNFIPIETKSDYVIYQYHVMFKPAVDSKSVRQNLLKSANIINEIGEHFVFDGMILYLTSEWENHQTIECPHPVTNESIAVDFKLTSRFGLNDAQTINCFNIVIRRCFDEIGFTQLGRNYFDPNAGKTVSSYNMDVLPGYETAIRMYEDQLMLCVENRFKMVRKESMLEIIQREIQNCRGDLERAIQKINEVFQGSTILTLYNNKLHRFTRLDTNLTPESQFKKDDRTISLREYYATQYQKTVHNVQQPIIISEGKPKQPGEPPQVNYLIPELCFPTGLTDEMRKDMKIMRGVASHTRLSPEMRRRNTELLLHKMHNNTKVRDQLAAWNIQLGSELARMDARVLPPEALVGGNGRSIIGSQAEWSKNVKSCGVFAGRSMTNWIVVSPGEQFGPLARKFVDEVTGLSRTLGIEVGSPMCQMLTGFQANDYLTGIKEALRKVEGHEVHMMVILLKDDNKTRYDLVKKFLCTQTNIPSQCVNLKTLAGRPGDGGQNKNFGSIVLKIMLQMVCKMGGALWKVSIPLKNTMIVGYDLYHDSTLRGKTIGACVSTVDSTYTQFYSQTRPHENPTQLGSNLSYFIRKALRKYYECNNNSLPERIILYRDGAGDGQIPLIKNTEVKLVRDACEFVCKKAADGEAPAEIKLAFIIVTKRVNMRVLKIGTKEVTNPNPGTVVDSVVTRPERYDFYMVPQYVNQGTVTPVSYNIIYDDTDMTADRHHKLAFKLCHLYYNWQGTVRVPAPCQYAHKMAFLVAQSIHEEAHEGLRDKLYFL